MGLFDCFEPTYFLISFFIGMFMVYITSPTPEVIIRYPTPVNSGKNVYIDSADMCYVYDSKEVKCTRDAIDTPLQHINNKEKNGESFLKRMFPSLSK
jgi:hypothetical protein